MDLFLKYLYDVRWIVICAWCSISYWVKLWQRIWIILGDKYKLRFQKQNNASPILQLLTNWPFKVETSDIKLLVCMPAHSSLQRWLCVWEKEHITSSLCFIVFSKLINEKHSGKSRYENVYFALLKSPSTKGYQQLL